MSNPDVTASPQTPTASTPASGSVQAFVIIYHHWWMDSGSFDEEIHDAKNREEAEQYAAAKCHQKARMFQNWDYHVVEAVTRITTEPEPRALTWSERIKGRVAPNA